MCTHVTRRAACRIRVRNSTALHSECLCRTPSIRARELFRSSWSLAPKREGVFQDVAPRSPVQVGRLPVCKHTLVESPWARPPPAQRASDDRETRRADFCDPPLSFSKTSTHVSCALRFHLPRGRNPLDLHRRSVASRRLSEGDGQQATGAGLMDLCRAPAPSLRHRCHLPFGFSPGKDLLLRFGRARF